MTTDVHNAYLESLLAGQARLPSGQRSWVNTLRAAALERAHALTVPTTRDEDWRFTDLSPLYRLAFRAAAPDPHPVVDLIAPHVIPEAGARLVFVDGTFIAALSSLPVAEGVLVASLAQAIEPHGELIGQHLGTVAGFERDAFAAINTAYLHDGAVIIAGRNTRVEKPVHVLHVSTQQEVATHPRILVIAEAGAELTLIEDYASTPAGAYCVNALTEIAVGAGARVQHVKLQRDSTAAFHLATCAASVDRDGTFVSNATALGARISRNTFNVALAAAGAQCQLDGLALISGRQLADTHSFVDHAKPHGTSRQLHKCVVGDAAHAVFNGRVLVRVDAQRTDSAQESRNLLLSGRAHVDTKPQLEILADDVKCSHGATVGQLDAEELFYLRSRGLAEQAARNLLTYGFAAEVVDRIPIPSIVRRLRQVVLEQTRSKDP
jgi:Fe-S cluster assembly protein SufD